MNRSRLFRHTLEYRSCDLAQPIRRSLLHTFQGRLHLACLCSRPVSVPWCSLGCTSLLWAARERVSDVACLLCGHRRGSALFERMDPPFRLLELRHTRCADSGILSLLLLLLQLSHRRSRLEASEATDFFRTTSQVAALRVGDSTACMQYSFSVRCRACPISSFFRQQTTKQSK